MSPKVFRTTTFTVSLLALLTTQTLGVAVGAGTKDIRRKEARRDASMDAVSALAAESEMKTDAHADASIDAAFVLPALMDADEAKATSGPGKTSEDSAYPAGHNFSLQGAQAYTNTSVYVTVFNYDTSTKAGKRALWMLRNLLQSMEPSLETAKMLILCLPTKRSDVNSAGALQQALAPWQNRVHVSDGGELKVFLRSTGIWEKVHRYVQPADWKIIFANFVLQQLAPRLLLVLDLDVVCNVKHHNVPSLAVQVGMPRDALGYALTRIPTGCDVACSLEDEEFVEESGKYNTGFCLYRRMPRTLSFLNEVMHRMLDQVKNDDQVPFNEVVREARAEDGGFACHFPSDVIETVSDHSKHVSVPRHAALCYHYVDLSSEPGHILKSSWANVQNHARS